VPKSFETEEERRRFERERKQRQREAKRQTLELSEREVAYAASSGADLPLAEIAGPVGLEHIAKISEDDYADREVAITKAQIEQGLIKVHRLVDGKLVDDTKDRLARTEHYARWRYGAFQRGEVERL